MAQLNTYTCDVCGAIKKEANHWFMARVLHDLFQCFPWTVNADTHEGPSNVKHICGTECLVKIMLRSMSPSVSRTETESSDK